MAGIDVEMFPFCECIYRIEGKEERGEGDVDDVTDDVGGHSVDGPCKMGSYSASIQFPR